MTARSKFALRRRRTETFVRSNSRGADDRPSPLCGPTRRSVVTWLGSGALTAIVPGGFSPRAATAADGAMLLQTVPGMPAAPAFSLSDIDGDTRTLDEFKGRVVVANFWATWCPPCRAEIPSMQRAWETLKPQGAQMLALHVGGDADQIWAFLAEFNVTFPVLIDRSGAVARAWQTIGLPTTYVVDPSGRKSLRAIGERAWDHPDIVAQILALKEPSP